MDRPCRPAQHHSWPSLLAAALLGVSAYTTITIVSWARARRDVAPPARPAAQRPSGGAAATTVTIGWVGDITPGSRYGLPAGGGRFLFASVRPALRGPDLMVGNLEGTFSQGGTPKCPPGTPRCYAFQAPPANAHALRDAGFDLVNLANNHSFDYGRDGQWQTLKALYDAHLAFTGLPWYVRVLTRRGIRVAFAGFSTYRWTSSMNDAPTVRAVVDQAAAIADIVVVVFHAGAEGSDRTTVPRGREWAYGEDRGDSRAFAHLAIDAGADLVLGSGPHVIRGIETYRGRLIAYSLGNFAGARNFASGGTLSLSGILTVRVGRRGRVRNGWWRGVSLDASGRPRLDPSAPVTMIARLSAQDFGAAAARFRPSGRILMPAGATR